MFVQSTRRKRPVEVLGIRFRFVTVSQARFFGVARRTLDGKAITVTNREKTLLDAAARPDLSGGIAQLAQALRAAYPEVDWGRLDDYLTRWVAGRRSSGWVTWWKPWRCPSPTASGVCGAGRRCCRIVCGPVGAGKSHTLCVQAIGHCACRQGYKVLYLRTNKLLAHLSGGRADGAWDKRLRSYLHPTS
jgi:hypothetical protein